MALVGEGDVSLAAVEEGQRRKPLLNDIVHVTDLS